MPRRYGQHFLHDSATIRRIVETSGVGASDAVLEIGPGEGALTRELACRVRRLTAIEVDRRLFSALDGALPPHVEVRLGDIMHTDLATIHEELGVYHVVANLPYDMTTDILKRLLSDANGPKTATLMVQKEVGERIVEKDGKTSRLSLFCGYYSVPSLRFCVGKGAFSPPPKVDSCVLRFEKRPQPLLAPDEARHFFALTDAAFAEKRKKVGNTLKRFFGDRTEERLRSAGIEASTRPEKIRLDKWMTLAREK